jgi:thymidylate synthase ThyX
LRSKGPSENQVIDGGARIALRCWFGSPYDGAIAAARTCYSDRVIAAEEITAAQRRSIGPLTFEAGHHTVYQHATFEFSLEGVSRQLVWSFLHRHPFYNSEQQSQRYVVLARARAYVPPALGGAEREIYEGAVLEAWRAYRDLTELLKPVVRERLAGLWRLPARKSASFHQSIGHDIEKRAIETARYVIPVACHTALVHTISGIVLHRLRRMVAASDVPEEAGRVVGQMVACVEEVDPDFFRYVGQAPLEESEILESQVRAAGPVSARWRESFDACLGKRRSLLVSYAPDAPAQVAEAVREVLGISALECADEEALDLVLNPARNRHRLDTLNVSMHSPLMRTLEHAHYTFRKKLSHSADSQAQRHRMVPGSRPLLSRHDTSEPDVVVPELIEADPMVRRRFDEAIWALWEAKNDLIRRGVDVRLAQYLLPNARAIRFQESGALLHLLHKWTTRTCLNAQREIYEASMDEVEQVREVHPALCAHIGPPCVVRDGWARPRCPEGSHFCGIPVWRSYPEVYRAI